MNTEGKEACAIEHLRLPIIGIVSVTDVIEQCHWNTDMCVVGTYVLQAY